MATKKNKKAKNYEFSGLGFPVVFPTVELRLVAGEWIAHVNMRRLQDEAFKALMDLPARLTGAQVAFIRRFMDLTQEEFAKSLGLSAHAQVSRWEAKKQKTAGLSPAHEANLRIVMRGFLGGKNVSVQEHLRLLSGALVEAKGPLRLRAA